MTDHSNGGPEHKALIRKLSSIAPLTKSETRTILALPFRVRQVGPDHDVAKEGDCPSECCLLAELLCRYKFTAEGRRQIFSFHFAAISPTCRASN